MSVHRLRRRFVQSSVAVLALSGLAAAQAQGSALSVRSVMPVTLDVKDDKSAIRDIALRLQQTGARTPVAFEVKEARLVGRSGSFDGAFAFGKPETSAAGILVPVRVNLSIAQFAGSYTVRVRPVYTEADKGDAPAELALEFVRPSARLTDMPELYLQRDAVTGAFANDHLTLTETSHEAFVRFPARIVVRDMRGPLGQAVPGDLELSGDGLLAPGGTLAFRPALSGGLPVGTHTGTIRFAAPQLATPVDLRFRLVNSWPAWTLPACIVLFIGLGILFRKFLSDRQLLEQAQLEAQRVFARLSSVRDAQADKKLKQAIGDALAPLAVALRQGSSAQEMQKAMTDAAATVDALLAADAAARAALRAKVVAAKESLGRPGAVRPALRLLIDKAQAELDELIVGLDNGELESQQKLLGDATVWMQTDLYEHCQQEVTAMRLTLDQVGEWPGIAAAATALQSELALAEQMAAASPVGELVARAIALAAASDVFLSRTLRAEAARVGKQVVELLRISAASAEGGELDRGHTALLQFEMGDRSDAVYQELASRIASYRAMLVKVLRTHAAAAAVPDPAVAPAIDGGDFVAAAKIVSSAAAAAAAAAPKTPKVEAYGAPMAARAQVAAVAITDAGILVDERVPAALLGVSLVGPAATQRGQPVVFQAVFTAPINPQASLMWTVQGGAPTRERSRANEFSFIPQDVGAVVVRCDVRHPTLGKVLWAQVTVLVEPSAAEKTAQALKNRVDRRELIISAITGVFIAGFGTLLFMDAFMGTWRDFFYAAVWGFCVDVGTARLRALADPMTSGAVPAAPAAHPSTP